MTYLFIFILYLIHLVQSRIGADISSSVSESLFRCLRDHKVDYIISRAYHSYGAIDTTAVSNIQNARSVGIKSVGYIIIHI